MTSAELYNPTSQTWHAAPSMHEGHNGSNATLLPSGRILVSGGWSSWNSEVYTP